MFEFNTGSPFTRPRAGDKATFRASLRSSGAFARSEDFDVEFKSRFKLAEHVLQAHQSMANRLIVNVKGNGVTAVVQRLNTALSVRFIKGLKKLEI